MVSEVTDMAGSLQLRSPEAFNFKNQMNGLSGSRDLNSFQIASAYQQKAKLDRSVPFCTVWRMRLKTF